MLTMVDGKVCNVLTEFAVDTARDLTTKYSWYYIPGTIFHTVTNRIFMGDHILMLTMINGKVCNVLTEFAVDTAREQTTKYCWYFVPLSGHTI